jgi:perosamine synthetase
MIPHSRPSLGIEEEEAALRIIRSGMLAQGAEVARLEANLAAYLGVSHVVAVSSGSAALHLALLVLDLPRESRVLLPSYVCTALLNAIRLVGATPVLADLVPDTLQISSADLPDKPLHAILAPHMFGRTVDLAPFLSMGIPVIEDCALALGARYNGRPAGSHGNLSVFSFYATKVICGGEGGAVATHDDALAARLRDLRDYDGRKDNHLRYNYKLTDLQAGLILAQLGKLDRFIARRRALGQQYTDALKEHSAVMPLFGPGEFPFRFVVTGKRPADQILSAFESGGVSARNPVFYPLHTLLGLSDSDYPHTARAHRHAVSIPLYPDLTDFEVAHILQVAQEVL